MNYIAVASIEENLLTIESNDAASLDTMAAFAELNYKNLVRFFVPESAFIAYSNGVNLTPKDFGYFC